MAVAKTTIDQIALSKLTYGATPADKAKFKKLGFTAWLNDQLNPKKSDNTFVNDALKTMGSLNLNTFQVHNTFPYSTKNYLVADETIFATLIRRYWSDRQVFEMLVEFFHDYNPTPRGVEDSNMSHYDKSVIRAHALGYYPDLVLASSRSPAMLTFLNGNDNTNAHPNENYGRELLELFTVSTAYPYKQADVVTTSRVLTGIAWWGAEPELQVHPEKHWSDPVSLFGWKDENLGDSRQSILKTSESMIRYLALMPATAKAFSLRMARRFVSDAPPQKLLDAMAATYLKTKGHIPSVFKTMALSKEFAASYRSKTKRPSEFIGSVIRGLDIKMTKTIYPGNPTENDFFKSNPIRNLHGMVLTHGHSPFSWPFPDGYPDTAAPWTTMAAQISRWNLGRKLAYGWAGDELSKPDYRALLPASAKTDEQIIDAAATIYLGAKLPTDERIGAVTILAKINSHSDEATWQRKAEVSVGMVLAKPEWNLR